MVNDIEKSIHLIIQHGGKIIQPPDNSSHEKYARFTDPFGNVFGLYQHLKLN